MHLALRKPHRTRGQVPRRCRARYLGQPQAWTWSNGDAASRSFDADARLTTTEFSSYVYDAASRLTSITQNLWANLRSTDPATGTTTSIKLSSTPITWAASYDTRNRLTSFGRTGTSTSYTYDANSNRLSSIDTRTRDTDLSGSFDQAATTTTAQATNQALSIASDSNRLLGFSQTLSTTTAGTSSTATTQVGYTLDANGNLTSDGQHNFVYDAANRLSQVDIVQGEQASNVTYLHNALGQRVFKSELQMAEIVSNKPQPGLNLIDLFIRFFNWLFNQAQAEAILGQSYLYDDATLGDSPSLLGEYGNGGNLSQGDAEYIWLPTEGGQAQLIGLYKNQRFYAIHTDHLGTPRLITDDTNQVVWQWAYSAFGDNPPIGILQATPNPDTSATPAVLLKATATQLTMNLRMAGQYFDEESGLFENGFRSYRPGMGSYSQFDPIGLAGGLDRRGYVGGSPLNFTDPHGLYAGIDDLVFSGGGAIVGLVGQGVSDLLSGHLSSGQDYAGAVVGGAVGGEALLYTGPIGAGLAGGAATNATKQFLKNMAGKQCGYNATSFVADTAAGGLTGLIPGVRILGVTGGRGSWNAIFKQMSTKFSNGSISNVSVQTALKMAGGRAVDTAVVPGMATGSVAGTYLEPYIPGYGDSCTCRAK